MKMLPKSKGSQIQQQKVEAVMAYGVKTVKKDDRFSSAP